MYIGIFGVTGCGKSTLAEKIKKDGFPSCMDINMKNVCFHDIDFDKDVDFTKKHFCYVAQDASHAGFQSYYMFDFLILGGPVPKGWVSHFPEEIRLKIDEIGLYQFFVFEKNCSGKFEFTGIIQD